MPQAKFRQLTLTDVFRHLMALCNKLSATSDCEYFFLRLKQG